MVLMENHYRGWSLLRAKIHSDPSIPKLLVQTSLWTKPATVHGESEMQ